MRRVGLLFAAVVVLVAACGGNTTTETFDEQAAGARESQTETSGAGTEAGNDATSSPDDAAATSDDGDGELTLNDFIPGFSPDDFEETNWREEELRAQQMVAECMAAEGFEYIPFVPSDVGGDFEYEEWDQEEYVKQYGFGVSTWVLEQDNYIYEEESDPWADDPNQEIVEAMGELEQEEYYLILYGEDPFGDMPLEEFEAMTPAEQEAFMAEAEANREPGCFDEAYESIYDYGEADAFYQEFGEDLDAFYQRAESDPRLVEMQSDWSACMADKGHDYATQEDMYAYFYGDESGEGEFSQRVNELITWPETDPSLFEDLEGGEEPEYDPSLFGPEYDIELLQPLIDEEIAVATADWECSQGYEDLWMEIYQDLERQFIEENMDRLLAYKEAHA